MILLYMALRRALGRAQTRAAKSCGGWGGQGKSLPRSFRLLQPERNLVLLAYSVAKSYDPEVYGVAHGVFPGGIRLQIMFGICRGSS